MDKHMYAYIEIIVLQIQKRNPRNFSEFFKKYWTAQNGKQDSMAHKGSLQVHFHNMDKSKIRNNIIHIPPHELFNKTHQY